MRSSFLLRHERPGEGPKPIGFHVSREAAEEAIWVLRFQPAYRDHPDGFSIEEVRLDRVARFSNATGRPLDLMVEPWAASVSIANGSSFAVHYLDPGNWEDASYAEFGDGIVTFWCEGSTYELEIDGEWVLT